MRFFSYIVARDYGFSPNPFWHICTLAACKADIRRVSRVGDWIYGTGAAPHKANGKLIYAMQVSEKLTFDQYWVDERFQIKKPIMNGSFKQMYGDNIYHTSEDGIWLQEDSHHALPDGTINPKNRDTDTRGVFVLISTNFYYFGKAFVTIPQELIADVCMDRQGFKYVNEPSGDALLKHIQENYNMGKIGNPIQFNNQFKRYRGR